MELIDTTNKVWLNSISDDKKILNNMVKYQYDLYKRKLNLEKIKLNNKKKVAIKTIDSYYKTQHNRERMFLFLSLLMLCSGSVIVYACYHNTDKFNKLFLGAYNITNTIRDRKELYLDFSLDDSGFLYGYLMTVYNSILYILLFVLMFIKNIFLLLFGFLSSLTELGAFGICGLLSMFFITTTSILYKFLSSQIKISLTQISISNEKTTNKLSDNVLMSYMNEKPN